MTAWGTPDIPQATITAQDEKREAAPKRRLFAPGTIKSLFHEAIKTLTGKPLPRPRRRKEDIGGMFKMAFAILHAAQNRRALFRRAAKVLRPIGRLRGDPANFAWDIPPDFQHAEHLRRLDQMGQEDGQGAKTGAFHYAEHDHLSPRL